MSVRICSTSASPAMWTVSVPPTSSVPSLVRLVSQLAGSKSQAARVAAGLLDRASRTAPGTCPRRRRRRAAAAAWASNWSRSCGELLGPDLVGLVVVLDVGVVGGDHQAAGEVDRLAGALAGRGHGPVELRDRVLVLGVALERAAEAGLEVAPLLALGAHRRGQREVAAGHLGLVVEGLVEDRLRILARSVSSPPQPAIDRRDRERQRADGKEGSDAGQSELAPRVD